MGCIYQTWTAAMDAALTKAALAGGSAREAALSVSAAGGRETTRCAAIGRATRLGLRFGSTAIPLGASGRETTPAGRPGLRPAAKGREAAAKTRREAATAGVADPRADAARPVLDRQGPSGDASFRAAGAGAETAGVPLMALEPHHCRWPVGPDRATADGPALFCGAAKAGRGPYCPAHGALGVGR